MRKKIYVVLFCITFLTASLVTVQGANISNINIKKHTDLFYEQIFGPIPGEMKNDELPIRDEIASSSEVYQNKPRPVTLDSNIITLIQQLDEDLLLDYLEELTAFGPRVTGTTACEEAGEYIYDEFVNLGLEVRYDEWENDGLSGKNIEATMHGIDESSDEIYIVCAHYDSVPESPGADDDGSGVAAVLASAKLMSTFLTNHTVRFVTFSGEEQGLYGSYYYVQEAVENNDNIVAVLNADMIGYTETPEDASYVKIFEDEESEWLTDYTVDINQQYNDFIGIEVIPSGYSWGSDHYYFWQADYNAIFYFEYKFNNYYHSSGDTIEHMDLTYATKNSKLIFATLAEISELTTQQSPNKPSKPTGETNGKYEEEYTYSTITTDPQSDKILYFFDWGDGTDSGWVGPFDSGTSGEASHTWTKKGSYSIKVKAKDTDGHESEWSDPLSVSMPKIKIINYFSGRFNRFFNLLDKLISLL
jgi:hypothetical protein